MTKPAKKQYSWSNYIDTSKLQGQDAINARTSLDWLEDNFSGFKLQLVDIRELINSGALKGKVGLDHGSWTHYSEESNQITYSNKAHLYVANDGKIYEFTLNEIMVHELEHAVQIGDKTAARMYDRIVMLDNVDAKKAKVELFAYLEEKGVNPVFRHNYLTNLMQGPVENLDPAILADPKYKELAQKWFDIRREQYSLNATLEDQADDKSNQLLQFLGKPLRGNYYNSDAAIAERNKINATGNLPVDTGTPEEIRKRNQQLSGYTIPTKVTGSPIYSGKVDSYEVDLAENQKAWDNQHNADTKNITSDEWVVIEAMRKALIGGRSVEQITVADKKDIEAKVDKLKAQFNKGAGNDGVAQEVISIVLPAVITNLPKNIGQQGWKF